MAWAAAPSYSAANIVNNGDGSPGPFAPNSILSIYGTDLAVAEHILTAADITGDRLPTRLDFTQVVVDNIPVPLLYVSEKQINFLIPSTQSIGPAVVRVTREGLTGPEVTIPVTDSAPALFINPNSTGYAIVSSRDLLSVVSPDAPAKAGDMVVIWATGLGKTVPNPQTGELPPYLAEIVDKADLKVLLDGVPVDSANILYAGLTPQSAGLYQINVTLPDNLGTDPEIRVAMGAQSTPAGLKLAVR